MSCSVATFASLYVRDAKVWLKDEKEGWVSATIRSVATSGGGGGMSASASSENLLESQLAVNPAATVQLVLEDEKGMESKLQVRCKDGSVVDALPPLANPRMLDGVDDLTSLSYLHEPAVLHNIRLRYLSQQNIYTYSGIMLVAVNPFQRLPIYSNDFVKAYSGRTRGEMEPHIFAIAEEAYRYMMRGIEDKELPNQKKNQSVIVSGESGAGKTVTAKYIMRFFATVDNEKGNSDVEEQVLATNPLLESFGNAKTLRNDNSSRFGKWIEIQFDANSRIIGANTKTFLLERSRVVYQSLRERNYHIFYQLTAGAQAAERKELRLKYWNDYNYLNGGDEGVIENVDDVSEFEVTQKALSTIGVSVARQWKLFKVLSGLLSIGNINTAKSADKGINTRTEDCHVSEDDPALQDACELLGLSKADFQKWMTRHLLQTRSESILRTLTIDQAVNARNGYAKFIYNVVFAWLINVINESLRVDAPGAPQRKSAAFIGILDIFGFEHFKVNSFEQFLINYANERLQQEYILHTFRLEQEEYVKENISWTFVDYTDNQPCIDLIEGKLGILVSLDDECKSPTGSDDTLVNRLYRTYAVTGPAPATGAAAASNNPLAKMQKYFVKPRFGNTAFTIRHFAHDVTYESAGFLEKNKDTISDHQLAVFAASSDEFMKELFRDVVVAPASHVSVNDVGKARLSHKQTVSLLFKASLDDLMNTLNSTNTHYIRAIKPNESKSPFVFEPLSVLHQLRACGVLETVRISSKGYPSKWLQTEFVDRYHILVHSNFWKGNKTELSKKILETCISDPNLYQIGASKIFFRAGQLAYIEKLRADKLRQSIVLIQKMYRGWLHRRRYRRLRSATILVQALVRGRIAKNQLVLLRRQKAATRIQKVWKGYRARARFQRFRHALIGVQSHIRGALCRKLYREQRRTMAAVLIQKIYRGHQQRRRLAMRLRGIVFLQSCFRRRVARRQFLELRKEARSIKTISENAKKLETKLFETIQLLQGKSDDLKAMSERNAHLETQTKAWRDRFERIDREKIAQQKIAEESASKATALEKELAVAKQNEKPFADQIAELTRLLRERDTQIEGLRADLHASKAESSRLSEEVALASKLKEKADLVPGLKEQVQTLQEQVVSLKAKVRFRGEKDGDIVLDELMISSGVNSAGNAGGDFAEDGTAVKLDATAPLQRRRSLGRKASSGSVRTPGSPTSSRKFVLDDVPDTIKESASSVANAAAPSSSSSASSALAIPSSNGGGDSGDERVRSPSFNDLSSGSRMSVTRKQEVPPDDLGVRVSDKDTGKELLDTLQAPLLEKEIIDRLIKGVKVPVPVGNELVSRRAIVFPAHLTGVYFAIMNRNTLTERMQISMLAVMKAIENANANQNEAAHAFWISNTLELFSIVHQETRGPNAHPILKPLGNHHIVMTNHRKTVEKILIDLQFLLGDLLNQFVQGVFRRMQPLVIPAVIESDATGTSVHGSSATLSNRAKKPSITVEQLIQQLDSLAATATFYHLPDHIWHRLLAAIMRTICAKCLNDLMNRKRFCSWKRGGVIMYNVTRLQDWCNSNNSLNSGVAFAMPVDALAASNVYSSVSSAVQAKAATAITAPTVAKGVEDGHQASGTVKSSQSKTATSTATAATTATGGASLAESPSDQLAPLLQAAKVLQLCRANDASMADIIFEAAPALAGVQIHRLLKQYYPDEFDEPLLPELLKAVANKMAPGGEGKLMMDDRCEIPVDTVAVVAATASSSNMTPSTATAHSASPTQARKPAVGSHAAKYAFDPVSVTRLSGFVPQDLGAPRINNLVVKYVY